MDKLKHTGLIIALLSYIIVRPKFLDNVRTNLFKESISEMFLLVIGIFIGWLLVTKYDETVGYLFIAAFIVFIIDSKKDNFSNAGIAWRDVRDLNLMMKDKTEDVENVVDHRNLPYHKYVKEKSEVLETKNNIDNVTGVEEHDR